MIPLLPSPTTFLGSLVALYDSGLSTRQIALNLGLSHGYVHKRLQQLAIGRSHSDAAILRQPAKSTHWRSCRQQARKVWTRTYGPIPEGCHIHHKDGDFTNNAIENLECLSARDHMILHHAGPDYGTPIHQRERWMATFAAYKINVRLHAAVCPECGKDFMQDKYDPSRTCGHSCAQTRVWRLRRAVL